MKLTTAGRFYNDKSEGGKGGVGVITAAISAREGHLTGAVTSHKQSHFVTQQERANRITLSISLSSHH